MPRKHCAVIGCHWSFAKLAERLKQPCFEHKGKTMRECSCPPQFVFHPLPKDPDVRRQWLAALKLKQPPKPDNFYVCSFHFPEREPTESHPNPQVMLGNATKSKPRRVPRRAT